MSGNLIKKLGVCIVIGVSVVYTTPKVLDWYSGKTNEFRRNKALIKTIELANIDNNCVIDEREKRAVRLGAGLDYHSEKKIEDFKINQFDKYLRSRGFKWNNKRKEYVEIK